MDKQEAIRLECEMDLLASEEITLDRHNRMCEIAHILVQYYNGKDNEKNTSICNQIKCKDICNECLFSTKDKKVTK